MSINVSYPYPTVQRYSDGEDASAAIFNRVTDQNHANYTAIKTAVEAATAATLGAIPTTEKGAANGVAELGADGKIKQINLPSIAVTDVFSVANTTERNALTVESGDVAIVADRGDGEPETYIYNGTTWLVMAKPADVVSSVNGQVGVVSLSASDVSATPSSHVGTGASAHAAATTSVAGFMTASSLTKLNSIDTDADVNQNAYTTVQVGATAIVADQPTDTITFASDGNVVITPNAGTHSVEFALPVVDGGDIS